MRELADIPGFYAPVHRALVEPILLGGAPRTVAIANGTFRRVLFRSSDLASGSGRSGSHSGLSAISSRSGPQNATLRSSMSPGGTFVSQPGSESER